MSNLNAKTGRSQNDPRIGNHGADAEETILKLTGLYNDNTNIRMHKPLYRDIIKSTKLATN